MSVSSGKSGKLNKSKSMREKLVFLMLLAILLQGVLLVTAIFGAEIFKNIDKNALDVTSRYLESRKLALEKEMNIRWSNIGFAEEEICQDIETILGDQSLDFSKNLLSQKQLQQILQCSIDPLLTILQKNSVTGAFVILDSAIPNASQQYGQNSKAAIYLRDMEPTLISEDNSDVLIERGPLSLFEGRNLAANSSWDYQLALNFKKDDFSLDSQFYTKPMAAARQQDQASSAQLGYWSPPFKLNMDDYTMITYTMPLLGPDQQVYGVIGVELSEEYFKKNLPYQELSASSNGAYTLTLRDQRQQQEQETIISGPYFQTHYELEDFQKLGQQEAGSKGQPVYFIKNSTDPWVNDLIGFGSDLKLYNFDSPFANEQWRIYAFLPDKEMFALSQKTFLAIMISLAASLAISTVIVVFLGSSFVRPIGELAFRVRHLNVEEPVVLQKVNIREIDDLSAAIEGFSSDVACASSKMSKIIDMLDLPIGAFETSEKDERIFVTHSLAKMLALEDQQQSGNYLSKASWACFFSRLTEHPVADKENTYQVDFLPEGSLRWFKINTAQEKQSILGVIFDVTQEIRELQRLEYERDVDSLTKLRNRRSFPLAAGKAMAHYQDKIGAMLLWDMDSLKYVNDNYGHDMGDLYLQKMAEVLNHFQSPQNIAARRSGDEFIFLLCGYDTKQQVRSLVEQIEGYMHQSELLLPDGESLKLRASAGMAWYPDDAVELEELLRYADFSMYETKHSQKGAVREFSRVAYQKNSFLIEKKEALNQFIDKEQFHFAFQPIYDIAQRRIMGYEALMRPKADVFAGPMEVLLLARSQSKLYQVEKMVVNKAMAYLKNNQKRLGIRKLFINSIANQVLREKDLRLMEKEYMPLFKNVVIEITEEEQCSDAYFENIKSLVRRLGCQVAIDDFGAGYNNELRLLITTPNYIKIDLSIVRGIDQDLNRQQLLGNIISYASSRGIGIIAEGVETEAELRVLVEMGVGYLQGYLIARPQAELLEISPLVRAMVQKVYAQHQQKHP